MPIKDAETTVCFWAEDVANGGGKTLQTGSEITLRLVSDGSVSTPSGSLAEVDATNLPGLYKLLITSGENDGSNMILGGKSSTADIVIRPVQWTNVVHDPDVANIPTTMRGTDDAFLAASGGVLADATVSGNPTADRTLMAYVKQLVNAIEGDVGIVSWDATAAPANGTNIAEVLHAIHANIANLGAPLQAAAFTALSGTAGEPLDATGFEANGLTARAEDWYADQTLLWTSGNLDGLAFFITGSSADDIPILTVQEMPEAPADTDAFTILGTKGS